MKGRIIIMYVALLLLSGCGGRSVGWQTGNVTLVRAVGVDLADTGVTLAACGGDAQSPVTLTADGTSVAGALQVLQEMGDSFVHFGHVDQMLMGEDFARHGVMPLVDFVARDRQIGPGARLWVLRGGTAEQCVLTGGTTVAARLERLAGDRRTGARLDCSVTRLMQALAGEDSVPIPALRWEQEALQVAGYAVLRQGHLVGFLDGEQSLGLELLCGHGAEQTVDVSLSDGEQVVLSVKRASMRCIPRLEDGRLTGADLSSSVRLEVAQGARVSGEQRRETVHQVQEILCRRMAAALACAQFWDADFVGVEQLVRMSCSAQEWRQADWDFRALPLQVTVSAEISWLADMAEE